MSYKTYENYKDSKISWANEIPSSWEINKLKRIFEFEKGKNAQKYTEEYVNSNEGYFPVYSGQTKNKGVLGTIDSYEYAFNNNVILVTTVGAKAMTTFRINGKLSLSQNCALIKLKSIDNVSDYYYYLCKILFNYERGLIPDIMQPSLRIGDLNTYDIIEPPKIEQIKIANYLDKKTTEIDNNISKNKELISLLEEKKVALINQCVTKGLNPNVPMKDSGIEWIGEIPEHWEINKIKNTSYVKGRIGWHGLTSEEYSDEGAYLVTGTDFDNGIVDWEHCNHISYERYKQDPNIHLKKGDLLITKDGTIGKLALVSEIPDKATLNSGIFLVRPLNNDYLNEFLYWILSSDMFKRFFDYIKTGATIAHLYQETFERFFFSIPSLDEQKEIINYLENKVSKLNESINKVQSQIDLLEEYKESLIHHTVTGNVDVREVEV